MNITVSDFSIFTIINFMFNFFSYTFFMNRFLHLKYNRFFTNGISTFIYIILLILVLPFFERVFFLKPFALIIALYFIIFILYDESLTKKLICPFVLLGVSVAAEIPFDFFLVHFFDMSPYSVLDSPSFYIAQIFVNILSFLFFYYIAKMANNKITLYGKYKILLFLITIQTCIIIFSISQSLSVINEPGAKDAALIFLTTIIIITIFIDLLTAYLMYKFNQSTKLELVIQKIKIEYNKNLALYEKNENDEHIRHLRHDLINFLENKKIEEVSNENK